VQLLFLLLIVVAAFPSPNWDLNKRMGHTVALPFTLKSKLMQKKNYGYSNISPCKKYNLLQKNPLK